MVISLKKHLASEKRPVEQCIRRYPQQEEYARKLIARMNQVVNLDSNSRILEIGAAQGSFLIACKTLGYSCEGVEPCQDAIEVSKKLSQEFKVGITIKKGFAEDIPYGDSSFDVVIALSVVEHVRDVEKVFDEVFRVLKPGGRAIFLEHMRSANWFLNIHLYLMNLVTKPMMGTSMIRDTQKNIEKAGFEIESVENLIFDVVRLIVASKR